MKPHGKLLGGATWAVTVKDLPWSVDFETWTQPKAVNDDNASALNTQLLPNLSVAPDGRLDMVWWDFRNDPGTHLNDVYHSVSNDNGQTWSPNRRITDQSINRKYGSWSTGFDMRQPPGIASTNDFTLIAWDDTRDADPVGQAQGLYGTALQYQVLGSGSNAAKYALAGVVGLGAVGLVVLLLALLTGRTAGPQRRASAVTKQATVRTG